MKTKTLLVALIALLCVGCNESKTTSTDVSVDDGTKVYDFGTGTFRRIDIDGVDCVIGAGTYDHTAAVSCDWDRKDT